MFNTISRKIQAVALTLLLAFVFSAITTQAQTLTSKAYTPRKQYTNISAVGVGQSSHYTRQLSTETRLYQYYGGSWHQVASRFESDTGRLGLASATYVRCTGSQTPYYFYTLTISYAIYNNGVRRTSRAKSPSIILTC